jgi:membrane-associated phospholipid phosphatase
MNDLKKWLLLLAVTAPCLVISYEFLDRPIAFHVHEHVRHYPIFARATELPELVAPVGAFVLLWLGIRALLARPLSSLQTVILLCSLSLVVTDALKRELKAAFGRTWPETWVRDNPSLIRDGAYGFHPFHGGPAFAAFPSGHTAAVCSVVAVLWLLYPRWRWLYAALVLVVAGGLVAADYHFLSDVIAGAFIGISIGWMSVRMWNAGTLGSRVPDARAAGLPPPERGRSTDERSEAVGWGSR